MANSRKAKPPKIEDESYLRECVDDLIRLAALYPDERYALIWLRKREQDLMGENAEIQRALTALRMLRINGGLTTDDLIEQLTTASRVGNSSLCDMAAVRLRTLQQCLSTPHVESRK